jgi:predicted dehydrogenase
MHPVKAIVIGAGERGTAYGRYALAHPDHLQIVAVAEPRPTRRAAYAAAHGLPPERCYASWEELPGESADSPLHADVALICTPDHLHTAPALAAMQRGLHVLLEKPMATTLADCQALTAAAERTGRHLHLGHVLRYAPFFQCVAETLQSGRLGDIITIELRENVSYWHMAHSFVRGNWRNSATSCPMILAKCCHDLDLMHWFAGAAACEVSSAGSLRHFRPENAPPGATPRCTDCPVERECLFSAVDHYVRLRPILHVAQQQSADRPLRLLARLAERQPALFQKISHLLPPARTLLNYNGWPVSVITEDTTPAGRLAAISDPANPYGRCVYQCDNDVVDHQHVTIRFANQITGTLIMHGHSWAEGRTLRIDGTAATLIGHSYTHEQRLTLHDKRTGRTELLQTGGLQRGHGGGDSGLMAAFVQLVRGEVAALPTAARHALESHLIAFSAEIARTQNRVVSLEELR